MGTVSRSRAAVHLERTLPAGIDTVWAAWTDPERMSGWLAPVDGVPGPGATFVLQMDVDETATCTVTRWEPPRLVELTWDYTGEGSSRLRIELSETDGGTRLVLDHDRLTDSVLAGYGAGWHVELEFLHAYLARRVRAPNTGVSALSNTRVGRSGTSWCALNGGHTCTEPRTRRYWDGGHGWAEPRTRRYGGRPVRGADTRG